MIKVEKGNSAGDIWADNLENPSLARAGFNLVISEL